MSLRVEIADGPAEGAARVLGKGAELRLAAVSPNDGAPACWDENLDDTPCIPS